MTRLGVLSLHTSPLAQPGTGDSGGLNVYVRELTSSLAQAGVASTVYTRRWRPGLPAVVEVEPGFTVVHVDGGTERFTKDELPGALELLSGEVLARLLEDRPDALFAHYWLSGVVGHQLKHQLDLPLMTTFHTLALMKGGESEQRARAEREIIGCSDAVLASSSAEAELLREAYEAPADRVEIVPPGVDHAFFSPGDAGAARAALGLADQPVLLFVGRIQPLKGLPVAIRALAALPQPGAVLVVVGGPSGPEGAAELHAAHRLARELGVDDRVRFTDPQPHHLLSTYYRAADVCLVPSRSESFGLVALEAAACGTPVVAADVGGLAAIVDHGRTGFLVDGWDAEEYAARVLQLLVSPELASAVGDRAAERARAYTWSTTAARIRRLCGDMTARAPVSCG